MTANTKTYLAGAGLIGAALLYLFYHKRKTAAAETAAGGGSGGGFAPTMALGGIPLVNYDGNVIAIVPVDNNDNETAPENPSCQPPVLDAAFVNAQSHLMVEWVPQGSNYNAVTVQTSLDNGASWANSTTGYNQTPLDMGNYYVNHAVANNIDNIRVRVFGNCSDGKQTAVSNTIIVPIS